MLEVHRQFLQHADKLDNMALIGILSGYGRQIRDIRKQIQSSFWVLQIRIPCCRSTGAAKSSGSAPP